MHHLLFNFESIAKFMQNYLLWKCSKIIRGGENQQTGNCSVQDPPKQRQFIFYQKSSMVQNLFWLSSDILD